MAIRWKWDFSAVALLQGSEVPFATSHNIIFWGSALLEFAECGPSPVVCVSSPLQHFTKAKSNSPALLQKVSHTGSLKSERCPRSEAASLSCWGQPGEFARSWKWSLSFRENQMWIMCKKEPGLCTGSINFASSGTETWVIPTGMVCCPCSSSSPLRALSSMGVAAAPRTMLTHDLPCSFLWNSCSRCWRYRLEEAARCCSFSGARMWEIQCQCLFSSSYT